MTAADAPWDIGPYIYASLDSSDILPGAGSLVITGHNPVVGVTETNVAVLPDYGQIGIVGHDPVVTATTTEDIYITIDSNGKPTVYEIGAPIITGSNGDVTEGDDVIVLCPMTATHGLICRKRRIHWIIGDM